MSLETVVKLPRFDFLTKHFKKLLPNLEWMPFSVMLIKPI
jgi:hypothetical protein